METCWKKPSNLHSMQMVWLKFKQLNGEMKRLARREPGKVEDRIAQAREKLKTIQIQMRDPARSLELVQVEAKAKEELEKWLIVEESIAKQKSRVHWLKLGNTNITYFHAFLKNRQSQKQIRNLRDSTGQLL